MKKTNDFILRLSLLTLFPLLAIMTEPYAAHIDSEYNNYNYIDSSTVISQLSGPVSKIIDQNNFCLKKFRLKTGKIINDTFPKTAVVFLNNKKELKKYKLQVMEPYFKGSHPIVVSKTYFLTKKRPPEYFEQKNQASARNIETMLLNTFVKSTHELDNGEIDFLKLTKLVNITVARPMKIALPLSSKVIVIGQNDEQFSFSGGQVLDKKGNVNEDFTELLLHYPDLREKAKGETIFTVLTDFKTTNNGWLERGMVFSQYLPWDEENFLVVGHQFLVLDLPFWMPTWIIPKERLFTRVRLETAHFIRNINEH